MATTAQVFFGGVPTEPDVNKLLATYGTPSEGAVIFYDDISQVLQQDRHSSRFKTVVSAWRKQLLKSYNLDSKAKAGEGILILTPEERVCESGKNLLSSARQVRRGFVRASTVPVARLDTINRQKHDHMMRIGRVMHDAITTNCKALTYELKAVEQLPRMASR